MPIPVKCQCGAAFSAKDELAGKRVQCPKCKNPLAIPAPAAVADDDDYKLEAPIEAPKPTVSIFDQAGMAAMAPGMKPCPNCEAPMAEEAVLCVKCGYHAATGKVISGHKAANKSHGDAHAAVADSLLEKARESIEEDKESKEKETQEGMPWYVMLPIFLFFLLFLGMMLTLPNDQAFFYAGVIFILAGVVGFIYYNINVLMRAFDENLVQGLLCCCIPPYILVYIIMRWETCGAFFVNTLMMLGAMLLGGGLIFISPWLKPEEKKEEDEASLHRPQIEYIAVEKRHFPEPVNQAARRDIGIIAGSSSKFTNSRTA